MAFMKSEEGKRLRTLFLDKKDTQAEETLEYGIVKQLKGQNAGSLRLCDLLNALGRAIVGITYKNLIHLVGPRGGESRSRDKMDVVILKQGRRNTRGYTREEIAAVVEGKADPSDDMSLPEVVLQFMKHICLAIGGTPLCGTVFGFTWCGHRLRYWTVNPDEYHSSRLIDLKKDCHLADFVDMVILLVGPVERLLTSWQPGSELVLVKPGTSCPSRVGAWLPKDDRGGIMVRRDEPIGSRTAVWQGTFSENAAEPPLDIIMKASWLSEEMRLHEYKILDLLLNDNASVHFPEKNAETKDRLGDRLGVHDHMAGFAGEAVIKSRLPQLLGVIEDPRTSLPGIKGITMSLLVTRGLADKAIHEVELSGKRLMKLFADVFEILWYLSCRGVHYRDLNLGNILVRVDPDSGEHTAVLIDFGNAAYAGEERRRPQTLEGLKQAHLDDARSANVHFRCLRSYDSRRLAEALESVEKMLKNDQRALRRCEGADEIRKNMLERAVERSKPRLRECQVALRKHSLHRYIDDLESAVYCMCLIIGNVFEDDQNPALVFKYELEKQTYWNSDMRDLFSEVDSKNRYQLLRRAVVSVTKVVRAAQAEIALMDNLSIEITQIEHEAFKKCTNIMREAARTAPADAPENSSWTVPLYASEVACLDSE